MGDIILSNGSTITAEELASIADEVKSLIAKEAKEPSQYEEVGTLANLTTLPALKQDGSVYKLVRVAVELLKGMDGKEVSLRKTDTALQWQLGDGEWQDLLLLADIKGEKGDPFTYDDFTDEQIADLKRPATEAAETANQAAESANQAKEAADQAEALRAAAEVAREQAESSRQSAETARDQAESDRGEAEDLRQTNEDARIAADLERKANEEARTAAETARQTAEDNRATAESTREEKETERQNRETTRYANESARQLAEEARYVSEEERKANEEARRLQESDRQTNTSVAIANAEKATSDANTAAQNAIKAKEETEAATELANELNDHPWIIQQGVWYKWNTDTDQYESTGLQAKGDTGSSFNIVGIYPTIDDLKAAVPDGTDVDGVYAVGTGDPYDYYAWVFYNDAWQWVNQGQLRGPEGKSAYEVWLGHGNEGKSYADYIAYLQQPATEAADVANQAAEAANQSKEAADQAEAARIANESNREASETERQTYELQRQSNTATAISNAEAATTSANEAAAKANDAAIAANTAAENITRKEVPTLESAPTEETVSYVNSKGDTIAFYIGDECRVLEDGEYTFYKLYDLLDGVASWDEAGGGTALRGNIYLQSANYYNDSVITIKDGYIQ